MPQSNALKDGEGSVRVACVFLCFRKKVLQPKALHTQSGCSNNGGHAVMVFLGCCFRDSTTVPCRVDSLSHRYTADGNISPTAAQFLEEMSPRAKNGRVVVAMPLF